MEWMQREIAQSLQLLSQALVAMNPDAPLHRDPRLDDLIAALPRLTETDLDLDALCPICLVALRAHIAEEEMASVMESPAQDPADLGVTRLHETCNHVFCRKDITIWIRQGRNTDCPTCRTPLLSQERLATPLPEPSSPIAFGQLDANDFATTNADGQDETPAVAASAPAQSIAANDMLRQLVQDVLEQMGPRDHAESLTIRRLLETALPGIQLPPFEGQHGGENDEHVHDEPRQERQQQHGREPPELPSHPSRQPRESLLQERSRREPSQTRDDFAGMYT